MPATTFRPLPWPLLTGTALLATLFLYFIDEGRYSLEGLLTVGNLVVMSLYFVGLLVGLFGVAALLRRRTPGVGRTTAVLVLGTVAGMALSIGLFFALQALGQA